MSSPEALPGQPPRPADFGGPRRRGLGWKPLCGTWRRLDDLFLLARLTLSLHAALLIAPFGASCVLVFALPQSPLAQPRNVIGGHMISTLVGLCAYHLIGASPLSFGLAVGLAIAAMLLTAPLHPPAGADPIVVTWPSRLGRF